MLLLTKPLEISPWFPPFSLRVVVGGDKVRFLSTQLYTFSVVVVVSCDSAQGRTEQSHHTTSRVNALVHKAVPIYRVHHCIPPCIMPTFCRDRSDQWTCMAESSCMDFSIHLCLRQQESLRLCYRKKAGRNRGQISATVKQIARR